MSGIAQVRLNARRAIFARFSLNATLTTKDGTVYENVLVKRHTENGRNDPGNGAAVLQSGYVRLVFLIDNMTSAELPPLVKGMKVTLVDENTTYALDLPDVKTGPLEIPWLATQLR